MSSQRIDENSWYNFGAKLIKKDQEGKIVNAELQKEFLESLLSKNDLKGFLKDHEVEFIKGKKNKLPYTRMTEKSFFNFGHYNQELKSWETYSKLSLDTVSSHGFWAQIVLDLIDQDIISQTHLAFQDKGITGKNEILNAIDNEDKRDDVVRRVLRSMCNGKPRGKRIIYYDFPLGKSFWKIYWCVRLASALEIDIKTVYDILEQKYYRAISEKLYSSKSYLSYVNIYAGLVKFMNNREKELDEDKIIKIIDMISHVVIWKSMETNSPETNGDEINHLHEGLYLK